MKISNYIEGIKKVSNNPAQKEKEVLNNIETKNKEHTYDIDPLTIKVKDSELPSNATVCL